MGNMSWGGNRGGVRRTEEEKAQQRDKTREKIEQVKGYLNEQGEQLYGQFTILKPDKAETTPLNQKQEELKAELKGEVRTSPREIFQVNDYRVEKLSDNRFKISGGDLEKPKTVRVQSDDPKKDVEEALKDKQAAEKLNALEQGQKAKVTLPNSEGEKQEEKLEVIRIKYIGEQKRREQEDVQEQVNAKPKTVQEELGVAQRENARKYAPGQESNTGRSIKDVAQEYEPTQPKTELPPERVQKDYRIHKFEVHMDGQKHEVPIIATSRKEAQEKLKEQLHDKNYVQNLKAEKAIQNLAAGMQPENFQDVFAKKQEPPPPPPQTQGGSTPKQGL